MNQQGLPTHYKKVAEISFAEKDGRRLIGMDFKFKHLLRVS